MAKEKEVYSKAKKDKEKGQPEVGDDAVARYARIHALQKKNVVYSTRGAALEE